MKRKLLALALAIVMVFSLLPVSAFAATPSKYNDGGGKGTEAEPWLISNLTQLENLASTVNAGTNMSGKFFKLTADIGSSSSGLSQPIGTDNNYFKGNFDGDGHTVQLNMSVSRNYCGLFSYITGATIKNVTTAGKVTNSGYNVGGVCGGSVGTIDNCHNTAVVTSKYYAGGVCGLNQDGGTIKNCYNTGTVSGSSATYAGGVCGGNSNYATIENCYNTGTVSGGGNTYAGGVCGCNWGAIKNCYNKTTYVSGGFVGSVSGGVAGNNATFTNCYYPSGKTALGYGSATGFSAYSSANDLLTKLNNYAEGNPATYPADWLKWKIKSGENDGYPVLVGPHEHAFTYAVGEGDNANTITATCSADGCPLTDKKLTLTLTAPADANLVCDGNAKKVDFKSGEAAAWKEGTENDAPAIKYYLKGGTTPTYAGETNEGSAPVDAGTYVAKVTAGDKTAELEFSIYCAKIGTTYYASIEDALTAAKANDTVTLLADITAEAALEVKDGVTLDLNGKTLTLNGKTLTLNGSTNGATLKGGTVDGADDTVAVNGKAEITNTVVGYRETTWTETI